MRGRLLAAAACFLLSSAPFPGLGEEKSEEETVASWVMTPQELGPAEPSRNRTVILLHGFGGSPYDVKPLADALAGSGYRVVVPVVPGETALYTAEEREILTTADLTAWLGALVEKERARYGRRPFVAGFSMGGTLATIEAARGTIERLVLVSPYYSLAWGNSLFERLSRTAKEVVPRIRKPWKGKVNDPEGYRRYFPGSMEVSLGAFLRLQDLAREAKLALEPPSSLPPTLVLASPDDEVASFDDVERFFGDREGAKMVTFPGSNHILFYDYSADEAVEAAREFLVKEDQAALSGPRRRASEMPSRSGE